ncbi:MAG: molecular chaperone TorD family protein [Coriobacteriales bacterium]|jgi:TorA maturation chaperone TorD|nr:molecular chaperone TorD family protein [Coriobacteriales bacterium]
MAEKTISLVSIMEGRIAQYQFLSRLFQREMDEDYFTSMKTMRFPLNTGNSSVDEGYRLFHSYLSNAWERTLEDLEKDYLRVFLGSNTTAHAAAYPYESVHTSPERLIMQEARDEVLLLYRAAGLARTDRWKDGEDHVALELDFERILCERSLKAVNDNDDAAAHRLFTEQYNFLLDHLLNWVPLLVEAMEKFAKTDFYRALARLTIGFLEVEKEFLEEILEE